MKIGFLTPYNHLPSFKKFVESNFECIDISQKTVPVDYIFSAPNYPGCLVTNKVVERAGTNKVVSPSTGLNHIIANSVDITSIKNDKILEEITSTAEHNLYLILKLLRNVEPRHQASDLTLGILGHGRLGKMLEKISKPIFKEVKIKDINYGDTDFFKEVDILSINIDLTPNNVDFINGEYLKQFTKPIFISNTSRGEVVDENSIMNGLWDKNILGYATDVIKEEHTSKVSILKVEKHKNLFITPHIGGTALEAQEKAYKHVITKIL